MPAPFYEKIDRFMQTRTPTDLSMCQIGTAGVSLSCAERRVSLLLLEVGP
jgi:hypothetical protein